MSYNESFIKHHQRLLNLLRACSRCRSLETATPLHALAITLGPNPDQPAYIYNNIISIYAFLDEVPLARKVFDGMPHRTGVSYNSMISACSRDGDLEDAWRTFREMIGCGLRPNHHSLAGLLSCPSMRLADGFSLLAVAMKCGLYDADAFVGTALFGLAGRCGFLEEAFRIFNDMPVKSLMSWNAMMSLLGRTGLVEDSVVLFRDLLRKQGSLSEGSFMGVLSGLGDEQDLILAKQVHGVVTKTGVSCMASVMNSLINVYVQCARLEIVEKLFEDVKWKDVVTWNTIIKAMAKANELGKALMCLSNMVLSGIMPNQTTYVSLINSCINCRIPLNGELVHAKIIISGLEADTQVGTSLVDYYAKCNKLDDANYCFRGISEKNVISWNVLITGYADNCCSASVSLLVEMLGSGVQPNEFSFSAALKSATTLELLQLHSLVIKWGYERNQYVMSSLVKSYGSNFLFADALIFVTSLESPLSTTSSNTVAGILSRSGQYLETLTLLSRIDEPDIVSWNIVIAACARNGHYKEVIELFKHMHIAKICPDNYTFVTLISTCSNLCDLSLGTCIHGILIKTSSGSSDAFVHNVLIDMYGKCGDPSGSVKVFDSVTDRNTITWTALISALGTNGLAHQALERFQEMECRGCIPDKVTFNAVLTACRNGGLVREGMELFEKMTNYGVKKELDHYHCIVDLLVKNGHLKEAHTMVQNMPFPRHSQIWQRFLHGCNSW